MIKKTPEGIYFNDTLTCDLSRLKPELKTRFVDEVQRFNSGKISKPPLLVVTTAATHAGIVTGNHGFYRPDKMRNSLSSFTADGYPKPVLVHHNEMSDPVGRVQRATYRDLSNRYIEPMRAFKERFGGFIFTDNKADIDTERAFSQVQWVIDNLIPMKDYVGLGYGELDLHITDAAAAEKILDQRYLTVSVGFTSDAAYCSICHQDWASEGFCEHERGKTYDNKQMVIIPGKFNYEEVSWVNTPADKHAKVIAVSEKAPEPIDQIAQISINQVNTSDSIVTPILLSVFDGKAYRLDSFKKISPDREQEIVDVAKNKQNDNQEVKTPELIKAALDIDCEFPAEAKDLLAAGTEDAKRVNWVTTETDGHVHRAILDPATGNGWTDYVDGHSHNVVGESVQEASEMRYNAETGAAEEPEVHTHELDQKIEPLTDGKWMPKPKTKKRKAKKTYNSTEPVENVEFIELEDGQEIPEGYELVEEAVSEPEFEISEFDARYDELVVPILMELGANNPDFKIDDAKLSAEKRKGLSASTFCGPDRSFPVPDCAHVTAARRLIGRAKGLSDAQRSRILSCVSRKAKSLGCDSSSDDAKFEIVQVELIGQSETDEKHILAFTSEQTFIDIVKVMDKSLFDRNKEGLEEAAKVFGINLEEIVPPVSQDGSAAVGTPLTKAEAEAAASVLFNNITKSFVDKMIDGLNGLTDDVQRKEVAEYIIDKLIAEHIIDDIFTEYNTLQKELEDAKSKITSLTKANRDFYSGKQDDLARVIIALKVALKKPEFKDSTEEDLKLKTKELKVRSVDSLQDTLNDLIVEFTGQKSSAEQPIEPVTPELGPKLKIEDSQDLEIVRDLPDNLYQLAQKLQSRLRRQS